jgi:hypothetical protein
MAYPAIRISNILTKKPGKNLKSGKNRPWRRFSRSVAFRGVCQIKKRPIHSRRVHDRESIPPRLPGINPCPFELRIAVDYHSPFYNFC